MTKKIPEQNEGGQSDNEYSVSCDSIAQAKELYAFARKNLLDVNNWNNLCENILKADFKLFSPEGLPVERLPRLNDYFRIDIPGPGSVEGNGYDWVQVKSIENKQDSEGEVSILIKVAPVESPVNDKKETAHFFTSEASTTFMITREGKRVTAEIHGRNEKPNTTGGNVFNKVRNKIVANLAIAKLSDIQWKELCKGLVTGRSV